MCCMIEFDNHLLFNTFDVKTILIRAKWLLSIVKRKTGPMTCSLVKRVLSNVSSFTWKERCLTRWALSSCLPLKCYHLWILPDFPSGSGSKKKRLPAMWETCIGSLNWEDPLGGGNGNPLQYSCLENRKVRGAWWATVHGDAKSQTWLSN